MNILQNNLITYLLNLRKQKRTATLQFYADILDKNFPYYTTLNVADQEIFLKRLFKFRKAKNFHFPSMERDIKMEVLVSASAIQITFGLQNYMMEYFDDITIMRGEYFYGLNNVAWAGHVNHRGIHISWDHFMKGYKYRDDRYNLGLHEMAHALEYEFTYGRYSEDETLKGVYESVMRKVEGVRFHEEWQTSTLYTQEGLSNKHECWAESVELFFENPAELNKQYPELFYGIRMLLNQDPLASLTDTTNSTSASVANNPHFPSLKS